MQDHEGLELIATNDGSSDRSSEILHRAAARDPRIKIVERENRGLIATLNEQLDQASGDFVARMDADDIAYPNRLRTQLDAFAADPELAVSGCYFDTMYSARRMLAQGLPDATEPDELRVLSRFCTILRHPTVMYRRSMIPKGMLHYDESYPAAEDFDLFRRLADQCKVTQTRIPLLAYRVHDSSVSALRAVTMTRSHVKIVEEGLRRHYPDAAGTGFERIAEKLNGETVSCAADLMCRLNALEHLQDPGEQRAFRLGIDGLFYFFFSLICSAENYALAAAFVDQSKSWGMIRRRERPLLRIAERWSAAAALAYKAVDLSLRYDRMRESRDLRRVIPSFDRMTELARSIDLPDRPQTRDDVHA